MGTRLTELVERFGGRLEGDPDIEVTRFLTVERRFLHTPAMLGSIHFVDADGAWAAGMLQELVYGATDGWTHALDCAPRRTGCRAADSGRFSLGFAPRFPISLL